MRPVRADADERALPDETFELPDDAETQRLAAAVVERARELAATEGIGDWNGSGTLPAAFFERLAALYAAFDAYVAHALEASRRAIPCRAGCSRCCHRAVHGVFAFEAINLYRQLSGEGDYPALHAALGAFAERFRDSVDQTEAVADGEAADPIQRTIATFAAAAIPCPLLAGNRCRAYAQRPFACRMYHSLTDPALCTSPAGGNFDIELPQQAAAILWNLSDRLAWPFSTFLAQGLHAVGERRSLQPWPGE